MNKDNPERERLLDAFDPASAEEWREAAEKLLKGIPFEKAMIRRTPEGILLEPIFWKQVLEDLPGTQTLPGFDGYLRGTCSGGYRSRPWSMAQELPTGLVNDFNRALLEDLMGGQDAVSVLFDRAGMKGLDPDQADPGEVGSCGLSLSHLTDFQRAFREVQPSAITWEFHPGASGLFMGSLFFSWLEDQGTTLQEMQGCLGMDPLAMLSEAGNLPIDLESLYDEGFNLSQYCLDEAPGLRAWAVSTAPYHRAGASGVEELAVALASGVTLLEALISRGLTVDEAARQISFRLHVGPHFFMEVAKFRAFRPLWARVVEAFGGNAEAQKARVHARTGSYNKSRLDPQVNILRNTLEALSVVIAGIDVLTVGCFDELLRVPETASRRLARNTQILLQEECELLNTVDPAGGSWAIESLTDSLSRQAWAWFQEIEREGGLVPALESGMIQKKIGETAEGQETLLHQRRRRLVGTNVYPQTGESFRENSWPDYEKLRNLRTADVVRYRTELEADRNQEILEGLHHLLDMSEGDCVEKIISLFRSGATLGEISRVLRADKKSGLSVEALPNRRLAASYESLRIQCQQFAEETGSVPKIFLCCLGPLRKHKIRADFTRAFFEAGGFQVEQSPGYEEPGAAVEALKKSGAPVTVVCGTDEDYGTVFESFAKAIRQGLPEAKILLAGHPGEREADFREAGLDDFIFIKSNHYQTNARLLEEFGVGINQGEGERK